MKSHVNDIFSVTPLHYINAGKAGIEHFHFLLNCIIDNVNNATIEESTISTCPLLSKALDLYIRDLNVDKWNKQQAPTQYQKVKGAHMS